VKPVAVDIEDPKGRDGRLGFKDSLDDPEVDRSYCRAYYLAEVNVRELPRRLATSE
jgi:hypothetical protein